MLDETGRATFLRPGQARMICRAGSARSVIPVLVRPGHRPLQSDAEWQAGSDTLR